MKKILAVLALVLFGTISYAQWSTNGTNVYYNGGNVGIGTSTPADLLNVKGTTGPAGFVCDRPWAVAGGNAGIGNFKLYNSTEGSYFNFTFRYRANTTAHEVIQSAFYAPTSTFKEFFYFNFTSGKYEVRGGVSDIAFLNSGTVAIGMGTLAVPSGAKVAVGGKVVCKEIEVTLTGMPDYVFDQNYKLMSLYDVENFINTNKHLPDVPSAAEVTSKGLNLGDMNATLLQKVEELTLYMIQLKKENDALKARVSNLEK